MQNAHVSHSYQVNRFTARTAKLSIAKGVGPETAAILEAAAIWVRVSNLETEWIEKTAVCALGAGEDSSIPGRLVNGKRLVLRGPA